MTSISLGTGIGFPHLASMSGTNRPLGAPPAHDYDDDPEHHIARLTEAVAARDTFIAVAAHELRNPMTPLVGQIDLLLSAIRAGRVTPAQIEARLERIQHIVHRYMKRAEILLDVSRLTQGRLQLELEAIDLAALVRKVVGDFADHARRVNVPLTVVGPDSLRGIGDGLALEQIVENLVSNALKYGGCTPVEVRIEAHADTVRIQVRDHGPGIPQEARARVFEQFERAVGRGQRRTGFGVGLWVVRHLVEAMNGMVAIEDATGGGALFSVILPLQVTSA